MPMTFETGKIRCTKPVTLRSNLGLAYSFSGQIIYPVKQITCRPNGCDFTTEQGVHFRDIDMAAKGIEFVK